MSNDNQDKPSAEAVNNQDSAGQGASEPEGFSQNVVAPNALSTQLLQICVEKYDVFTSDCLYR